MTQLQQRTPGALNLNGIHYQLLRSLFRATLILKSDVGPNRENPQWSQIVLEPRTGGDHRVEGKAGVQFEQMKTRSGRTWPLKEVIHDVLPDLYRAFKTCEPERQVLKARFVTDGKRGQWEAAERFFKELRRCEPLPHPIWENLDTTKQLDVRKGTLKRELEEKALNLTRQGLFRYISQVLNKCSEPASEDDRRVWKLLQVFELEVISEEALRQETLDFLSGRVSRIEDAQHVLWEWIGYLLDRGKESQPVNPRVLLADFGLAAIDLDDRPALLQRGKRALDRFLENRGYDSEMDVRDRRRITPAKRQPDRLDDNRPVTVLYGESGQGKSWALYAKARRAANRGELTLVIEGVHNDEAIRDRAAARFCDEIWDIDEPLSLERLAKRIGRVDPEVASNWLTLFVDNVQDMALAREIAAYDWARQGIRVIFALTTTGREVLAEELRDCRLEKVEDFSARELSDFLKSHLGARAIQAPHSERSVLRRPLMARLFCDLVRDASPEWPVNEFELLASYWNRRVEQNEIVVSRLAALAAEPPQGRLYPWSFETVRDKLSQRDLDALTQKSSLLRMTPDRRSFEIWHDRLLNWAVAEGWVQKLRDRSLSVKQLVKSMRSALHSVRAEERWGGRWMARSVQDALWLMCEPSFGLRSEVDQILDELGGLLYRLDVTSFGPRIVPVLFDLVRQNPKRAHYAIETLQQIEDAGIAALASDMLRNDDLETRLAAARILRTQPTPDALDGLWALRIELEQTDSRNPKAIVRVGYALAACARSADDWIRRRVRLADATTEPVYDLAYLLTKLKNGRQLWSELKDHFFTKVPPDKERSIATCIETFQDESLIDWLEARCNRQDDYLGAAARRALFVLQPSRPPDAVNDESWDQLAWTRYWWLLPHLNAESLEAERLIAEKIGVHEDPWKVAWSLSGFENRVAPATLDVLLDAAEKRLADVLATQTDGDSHLLRAPASFLAKIQRLELIERIEARRGTQFEDDLTRWLCDHGVQGRGWGLTGRRALGILKRIGGKGITSVAHHYLRESCPYNVLLDAIELAVVRPDDQTADLLYEIALRKEVEGQKEAIITLDRRSELPYAQRKATTALLRIGRRDLAVRGALKLGLEFSWSDIHLFIEQIFSVDILENIQTALDHADGPTPGAVLAAGLARWTEQVSRIHTILEASPQGSEISRACLLALKLIGDRSQETVCAFIAHLEIPENEKISWLALLDIQTPKALEALKGRLIGLKRDGLSSSDNAVLIAANLLDFGVEAVRHEIADYLWSEFDRNIILFVTNGELTPFAELERGDIDEWLCELSLDESGNHLAYGGQTEVIRAFAIRDEDRAFDAALRLRGHGTLDLAAIPALLLDLDRTRALPYLRKWLKEEANAVVLAAIGEGLIGAGELATLIDWLKGSSPQLREGACIAAETLPWTNDLARVLRELLYDESLAVRLAANQALDRLWHARQVDRIVEEILAESDATRRWCLLDVVLEGGHPGLTGACQQPWMERLFQHLPLAMRQKAADRLEERRKELRNEMEKRKRSM